MRSEGPIGMAHAWLLAMLVVTFGVGALALVTSRRHSMHDWGLAVAASLKTLSAQFMPFGRKQGIAVPDDAELRPLLAMTGSSAASGWHALKSEHGPEGTEIVYLGDLVLDDTARHEPVRSQGTYAVLRSSRDPVAAAYLERLIDNLDLLRADTRLKALWPMLPTRLAVTRVDGAVDCIETIAPGTDGRVLLRSASERQAGLEAAASAAATLHGQTSAMRTIDEVWFQQWVERPAAKLAHLGGSTMSATTRRRAIDSFVAQQRRYWLGRKVRLGWCHGDLLPQSLNFAAIDAAGDGDGVRLACLLEWGNARSNAPSGFDGCVLAIAMRMMVGAEPLGAVVADLLWTSQWRDDERQWLGIGPDGTDDWSGNGAAVRAMVGLVWLHQVSARARSPAQAGVGRLWIASNVDRVLRIVSTDGGAI
ncbi:hypothetical protein QEZ47_24760 [Aminobacter anthyllidis]|uniref:hypothetical protein n=1 Tax=Aminobacter anthyllidis TaxID=1035067 RepID=UPI002456444B|nr:hypothetical protein [Aminobacter anthyllidis]MDH4988669.1 hypothetical protein [Aminobacter anthyllidis]